MGFTHDDLITFAHQVKPDPDVTFFSHAGSRPSGFSLASAALIPGESDGWVSVESARFGKFLGTVPANHLEEVGLDPAGAFNADFNHLAFYEQIVASTWEQCDDKQDRNGMCCNYGFFLSICIGRRKYWA